MVVGPCTRGSHPICSKCRKIGPNIQNCPKVHFRYTDDKVRYVGIGSSFTHCHLGSAAPRHRLSEKNRFQWGEPQVLEEIKKRTTEIPIVVSPYYTQKFFLKIDGLVPDSRDKENTKMSFRMTERVLHQKGTIYWIEKECLAIIWGNQKHQERRRLPCFVRGHSGLAVSS